MDGRNGPLHPLGWHHLRGTAGWQIHRPSNVSLVIESEYQPFPRCQCRSVCIATSIVLSSVDQTSSQFSIRFGTRTELASQEISTESNLSVTSQPFRHQGNVGPADRRHRRPPQSQHLVRPHPLQTKKTHTNPLCHPLPPLSTRLSNPPNPPLHFLSFDPFRLSTFVPLPLTLCSFHLAPLSQVVHCWRGPGPPPHYPQQPHQTPIPVSSPPHRTTPLKPFAPQLACPPLRNYRLLNSTPLLLAPSSFTSSSLHLVSCVSCFVFLISCFLFLVLTSFLLVLQELGRPLLWPSPHTGPPLHPPLHVHTQPQPQPQPQPHTHSADTSPHALPPTSSLLALFSLPHPLFRSRDRHLSSPSCY